MSLPQQILKTLRMVCQDPERSYPLHEPQFHGKENIYLKDCIDSGWVSSVGSYVEEFGRMLAEFVGVKHAVPVVNGTAGLHAALQLVGVGHNDEVIVPTMTFIATANSVSYCGAIPHFVDSDEATLGIDSSKLMEYLGEIADVRSEGTFNKLTGRRIAALIVMHAFGHPSDLPGLMLVCDKFMIPLVEDAAESIGSYFQGVHTGSFGAISVLSFNGNKTITTGGGGAILTNSDELGRRAKHLTTTARVPHNNEFFHDEVGYNYRMPNINAALGCAQMEQLPGFIEKKRGLASVYAGLFESMPGLRFVGERSGCRSNYWLNAIILDRSDVALRDEILSITNSNKINTRPLWVLMHRLPMYCSCPRMDLSGAEDLTGRLINIPSSASLAEA